MPTGIKDYGEPTASYTQWMRNLMNRHIAEIKDPATAYQIAQAFESIEHEAMKEGQRMGHAKGIEDARRAL